MSITTKTSLLTPPRRGVAASDDEARRARLSVVHARLVTIEALAHAILDQLDRLPHVQDDHGLAHAAVRRLFGLGEALEAIAAMALAETAS